MRAGAELGAKFWLCAEDGMSVRPANAAVIQRINTRRTNKGLPVYKSFIPFSIIQMRERKSGFFYG